MLIFDNEGQLCCIYTSLYNRIIPLKSKAEWSHKQEEQNIKHR